MGKNTFINETDELSEKLNRAHKELEVLYEISNAMRTTLELNHILHIILTGVTAHTGLGFNRAILLLVNNFDRCLEPKMAIGPESGEHAKMIWDYISTSKQHLNDLIEKDKIIKNTNKSYLFKSIKDLKVPLINSEENILSSVYHDGNPIHILGDEINKYKDDIFLKSFKTNELVIVPLKAKDKVNGLIVADNLYTKKPITEGDLKIFIMLANQAGLAIENSRLYEMVREKSHTDSLTNLWNHGFFQNKLSTLIENYENDKQPISLVLIDIDNFKNLNDTYGHQNGDLVLKEIASILKDSSRDIDYVCRYGGEEFSIILTQTSKEQGNIICERIRSRIENNVFPKFSLYDDVKITVSIGQATYPDDTKSKEELITKADLAMYKAKFDGKNRICLA